MKTLFDACDKF